MGLLDGKVLANYETGVFMPMVGKKKFAYTAKGKAMAKAEAKKSGKSMKSGKKKK
jgi:hypothetical protein